jgi:signal transduction histidine kinase
VAAGSANALINVLIAAVPVDSGIARELKNATGGSDFIFTADGRELASSVENGPPPESREFTTPLLGIGGEPVGQLRILHSFEPARRRIAELRIKLILLWIATVCAGFVLTFFLARQLVQPLRQLDNAAIQIGAGNYDVQVPVQTNDEIGRLARTFNSMCASIRSAREELIRQERISTIGRLTTSIVHDLRNPLASIYGGAELLYDEVLSQPQIRRLAGNIYRASRRVQELLQELIDANTGKAHGREWCRLRDVISAGADPLTSVAMANHVSIDIDVPADVELSLARSPMERVFQNLIANAIEAMPTGGQLRITAEGQENGVLVSVQDNGPGVPASIAAQLFQPFATAGKKNGMGLGLALSRETVREHGGDLWVDTTYRGGACFHIRLPVTSPSVVTQGDAVT